MNTETDLEGGWQPVLRNHGSNVIRINDLDFIYTLFVDNLPESMTPKGLYTVFSSFGIVKDVFIPIKRRKQSRSRFGFVRYDCPVAAKVAVQKAHGLWCDTRALQVKVADFAVEKNLPQRPFGTSVGRKEFGNSSGASDGWRVLRNSGQASCLVQKGKSFAHAVTGTGPVPSSNFTVHASEEGIGWLFTSVIVRLKASSSAADFKVELLSKGLGNCQIREGGGRDVVLTFDSAESMKESLQTMADWLPKWSEFYKAWEQGMVLKPERIVWLTCYGVPLNLWSSSTFRNIGQLWGEVVGLDEDTSSLKSLHSGKVRIATTCLESINKIINLCCEGVVYPVKVCEEQVVVSEVVYPEEKQDSTGSLPDRSSGVGSNREEAVLAVNGNSGGDLESRGARLSDRPATRLQDVDGGVRSARGQNVSLVAEAVCSLGQSICGGASLGRSAESVIQPLHFQNLGTGSVEDDVVVTPGFVRSFTGPERHKPGLNLEVFLAKAQDKVGVTLGQNLPEASIADFQPTKLTSGHPSIEEATQFQGATDQPRATQLNSTLVESAATTRVKTKGAAKSCGQVRRSLRLGCSVKVMRMKF